MNVSFPELAVERKNMDNKQYIKRHHNRLKTKYRITLGFQQLLNYPVLNFIWLLFAVGVVFLVIGERQLMLRLDVHPLLVPVFGMCMKFALVSIPIICVIGIIYFIGEITAIRDEADMSIVFGDKRDVKNQPPMLIYKKKDRKSGVIKREFYTTIPMERWQEKREAICDRLNVHIIGEITYGGRNRDIGNRIIIESAKGRKSLNRGVLYDDTF